MQDNLIWDGRVMTTKKNLKMVNFRLEPDLIEQLNKIKNKSELIRKAVKEKLEENSTKKLINN